MRKVLSSLFLSLFLVFASQIAFADMHGGAGKGPRGMSEEDMPMHGGMKHSDEMCGMRGDGHHLWGSLKGLGLDEKQKVAIKEIKSRVTKETIKKRADVQVARVELRDMLDKDPVDVGAVEAKIKQISAMAADIRIQHVKAIEEIKTQLTPEQREKFKKTMKRHWRKEHCGMGMSGKRFGNKHHRHAESE